MSRARPRWLAFAAVGAGLLLAGVTDPVQSRVPVTALGYTVVAGDFHVHGFPDGILPWDAAREARRRRLDVIALTSHNSMRGWRLWARSPVAPPQDVIVLPGEELTSAGYHLALVGVTSVVPWRQSLAGAAAAARAQGGVAILAHPSGDAFRRSVTDEGLRAVDGIEVAHPSKETSRETRTDLLDTYQRTKALNPRVAAIGSSDFHVFGPLGLCRTYLFVRERSAAGVLEAIRAGRTAACDGRGRAGGPPELASAIADRCREDALAPPAGDTLTSRAGTALVWAGLVALVVFGVSGDRRP